MIRRKKSSSGRTSRRKRGESSSPTRRRGSDACHPPSEFSPYDYEKYAVYILKSIKGQVYPFLSNGFIHCVHELEYMMATNQFTKEYMAGEIQFMTEGFYPTPNLSLRQMPMYDKMADERTPTPLDYSESKAVGSSSSVHVEEEQKETEICLLPEDREDDDMREYPAPHMGTRFWSWCRQNFMGEIDTEFLEIFKETILDAYSDEALQKYLVNEPWKYRKRAPPPLSSRRKSLNTSNGKSSKKVSISSIEVTSPTNGVRSANRKSSLAGYRIPNRRALEKEKEKDSTNNNNNKLVPMIGSMVYSACREARDSKTVETPTTRRGRVRMTSREHSKERERKYAKIKMESDSDEDGEQCNGSSHRSSRLHSPRQIKKEEKFDDDYEKVENGHCSTNGLNGHSKAQVSPKRKNGDIRNYFNSTSRASSSKKTVEVEPEEIEMPSDIEDFDAKAIGSRIVSKLIAGGILPESSAHIFEQMTLENNEDGPGTSSKVEMSEEGKEDAEDQEVGELAEELQNLQMSLREEMIAKKALFVLAWRRAKSHFAFFHTFNQLKIADYDLFRLGVNIYRDFPRKLPGISETMVLKETLRKRNRCARLHYSKLYRRHPKYRWHRGHVPAGKRVVV